MEEKCAKPTPGLHERRAHNSIHGIKKDNVWWYEVVLSAKAHIQVSYNFHHKSIKDTPIFSTGFLLNTILLSL